MTLFPKKVICDRGLGLQHRNLERSQPITGNEMEMLGAATKGGGKYRIVG